MPKNQKNTLISYILFYSGFMLIILSLLTIVIYTIPFKNYQGNIIHLLCFIIMIVGIILPHIGMNYNLYLWAGYGKYDHFLRLARTQNHTGLIQGIPNNSFSEFNIKNIETKNNIKLVEVEKGIFCGNVENKTIKFDMKWWIRKEYYIYEIILTMLQCEIINSKNIPYKSILKSNTSITDYLTLDIERLNNKRRKK